MFLFDSRLSLQYCKSVIKSKLFQYEEIIEFKNKYKNRSTWIDSRNEICLALCSHCTRNGSCILTSYNMIHTYCIEALKSILFDYETLLTYLNYKGDNFMRLTKKVNDDTIALICDNCETHECNKNEGSCYSYLKRKLFEYEEFLDKNYHMFTDSENHDNKSDTDPLTIGELREIDGEPVFCIWKQSGNPLGWGIVNVIEDERHCSDDQVQIILNYVTLDCSSNYDNPKGFYAYKMKQRSN